MKLHTFGFIIIATLTVLNSKITKAQRQEQKMDMEQTLSDGAQRTKIAFDALDNIDYFFKNK